MGRQIPFDAGKSIGWAESATKKESATSKVNPSPSWDDLVRAWGILSVGRVIASPIRFH
jgi:hypothetical protein